MSVKYDVTGLKGQRREAETRYHELYSAMTQGVVYLDHKGAITAGNPAAERILGLSPREMSGLKPDDPCWRALREDGTVFPQEELPAFVALREGTAVYNTVMGIYNPHDNAHRWLVVDAVPRFEVGAKVPSQVFLLFSDISRQRTAQEELQRRETFSRSLIESSPDCVKLLDIEGKLLEMNANGCRLMEIDDFSELRGHPWQQFWPDPDKPAQALLKARSGEVAHFLSFCPTAKGTPKWWDVLVTKISDPASGTNVLLSVSRDVTESQMAEARFRSLFETMTQGVVYHAMDGKAVSANPAAERILGLNQDQLLGRAAADPSWHALDEGGRPFTDETLPISVAIRTGQPVYDTVMQIYNASENARRWLLVDVVPQYRPGEPAPHQVYALFDDVTQRKEAEEALERVNQQLYHNAFHDALTELPNRLLLTERLNQLLKRQNRYPGQTGAVLYMDFDRFKVVNDSLGHAVGDAMLRAIAERLRICVRPADTVARLGGDEFIVLVEMVTQPSEAVHIAERITNAFSTPLLVDEHELHTSASIGIVSSTAQYASAQDILRDADVAMYRAKAEQRGSYRLFSAAMRQQIVSAHRLESELRQAISQHELRVFYQPIMDAAQTLTGFEALVRWQHPKRGLLTPDEFMPFAEEVGLVREIDFWVWREACTQVDAWQRELAHPVTLSLNLSSQQFLHADLVGDLGSLLHETGFDPLNLVLEITEGAFIDASTHVSATIAELKRLGVRLYLDDFGTGYSSLSYLQRFPVDALKIDRSFVANMLEDRGSAELVRTILAMAQNLGLVAVAEGVENAAQLARLRELGCAYTQGFLYARPLEVAAAEMFLLNWT